MLHVLPSISTNTAALRCQGALQAAVLCALTREDEVSPDLIKAHVKNFYPNFFLYSSQTWALDPHALEIVFGMCKDLEIISLVFLTRYAWDNVFSSAGEERGGGHSLGGIRLETRYIGVLQAASYVLIVNCGDEARRKMELVGESARLLVLCMRKYSARHALTRRRMHSRVTLV